MKWTIRRGIFKTTHDMVWGADHREGLSERCNLKRGWTLHLFNLFTQKPSSDSFQIQKANSVSTATSSVVAITDTFVLFKSCVWTQKCPQSLTREATRKWSLTGFPPATQLTLFVGKQRLNWRYHYKDLNPESPSVVSVWREGVKNIKWAPALR